MKRKTMSAAEGSRSAFPLHDRFLTRRQAAEMLGLAVGTLAVWQSQQPEKSPPMRKHGSRAMYAERELLEWSERRRA